MRFAPAVVLVALVLSGCTSSPAPVETPAAQEPVAAPAVATAIAVSGTALQISYDDESTKDFAFTTEPGDVVEALTLALGGPPAVAKSEELACQPSFTNSSWPGLGIRSDYASLPDGQRFAVTIDAATSGSIALSTSEGVAVGSDGDDAFAAFDGAKRDRKSGQGANYDTIFFDRQGDGEWGGYLFAANDAVVTIIAPVEYATLTC